MKLVVENKWFIVFFLVWTFVHIILFISGVAAFNAESVYDQLYSSFWPFGYSISDYGLLEFFVYETLPVLIFIVVKLVGKDIKKAFDENN